MMTKSLAALLLLLLSPTLAAAPEDELLEPDQAFRLTTRTVSETTLEASWKIAPGYYMYRDKFQFEALDGTQLKAPVIPRGKVKDDPLFGKVETYTKAVKIRLPFTRAEGAATARLRITSQGCNEPVGVCYPPVVKEIDFKLPPGKAKPRRRQRTGRRHVRQDHLPQGPHAQSRARKRAGTAGPGAGVPGQRLGARQRHAAGAHRHRRLLLSLPRQDQV